MNGFIIILYSLIYLFIFFLVLPVSAPVQTPGHGLIASQSTGAKSLQQAFFEPRQNQNQFDSGPNTAPASVSSTHPPLQPAGASHPSQSSTVLSIIDGTVGHVPSTLNQVQEQVLDSPLPPPSTASTYSTAGCVSSSCTTSPPAVLNQSPLQTQSGVQAVSQSQAQIQPQAFNQPQPLLSSAISTSLPSAVAPASFSTTNITSPPPSQNACLLSSPPLSTSNVSSNHPVSSLTSSTPPFSSSDIPTTDIQGTQLIPSAASQTTSPSSTSPNVGLQPVTASVPLVQPTLVHSQPQTATLAGQMHNHCGECDARWLLYPNMLLCPLTTL